MHYQPPAYQGNAAYSGIGRIKYYLYNLLNLILFTLLTVGIFAGGVFGSAKLSEEMNNGDQAILTALIGSFGAFIAALIIPLFIYVTITIVNDVRRMQNTGSSGWLVLLYFVPLANLWVWWRLVCCPEGYNDHKTLDLWGKFLTFIFFILPIAAIITAVILGGSVESKSSTSSQDSELIIEEDSQEESLLSE